MKAGVVLLALAASSCGVGVREAGPQRYETSATILQEVGGPVNLCVGVVLTSDPPQCGGPEIPNWNWDEVDGENSRVRTTWGEYHVVGTVDGDTFTLTEPPGEPRRTARADEDLLRTPCTELASAPDPFDPARVSDEAMRAVMRDALAQPDFAGRWLDRLDPDEEPDGYNDPNEAIVNIAFAGDIAEHERTAREIWHGALCVSRMERTHVQLEGIAEGVQRREDELGLDIHCAGVMDSRNVVTLCVLLEHEDTQTRLDALYGPGAVDVDPSLIPVA